MSQVIIPQQAAFTPGDVDHMAWINNPGQPGQIIDAVSCTIYPELRHQTIEGIGGSFSEVGADYLQTLDESSRSAALQLMFDPTDGGFSFCRMPIGASDFGRDAYSLAEVADDYDLKHFTIERDRAGLLSFIQDAQAWQPDLQLHASPWSPPAWMKTNKSLLRGGKLCSDPGIRRAYADYFVRFVQAYEAEGVTINRVMQQNEPDVPTPYPSCEMLPDDMVPWTVDYLRPAFEEADLTTQIWGGTFRMVGGLTSHECLLSAAFREAVDGLGFQYSFTEPIRDITKLFPNLPVMHTESVCHEGANSWTQAVMLFDDIVAYLNAGCTVYTYWNMVLDQLGFSSWYWRQNSLIKIDTDTA